VRLKSKAIHLNRKLRGVALQPVPHKSARQARVARAREQKLAVDRTQHFERQVTDYNEYTPPTWGWAYLEVCLDPGVKNTVSARCAAAGIDRATYYAALQDPFFKRWMEEKLTTALGNAHVRVRNALVKECEKGSIEHLKLFFEQYGIGPGVNVIVSPGVQLPRGARNITLAIVGSESHENEQRSDSYREVLGRVVEHHIEKAKAFGMEDQIPEEWRKSVDSNG